MNDKIWSGQNGDLNAIKAATKNIKKNLTADAVKQAYAPNVIKAQAGAADLNGCHFVEVMAEGSANFSAALYSVLNSAKAEEYLAAMCVSPHVSDKTLANPSTWAKWQRVVFVDGRDQLVKVHWLDIIARVGASDILLPYRTSNWYGSLLLAGISGHFLTKRVVDADGDVMSSGTEAAVAWINKIGNESAKTQSLAKYNKVLAWMKVNKRQVASDRKAIKTILSRAKWVTD